MGLFSRKTKTAPKRPGPTVSVREDRGPQPASWPKWQCWTCGGTGRVSYSCPQWADSVGRCKCGGKCDGGNIYKPCDNPDCWRGRVDGN